MKQKTIKSIFFIISKISSLLVVTSILYMVFAYSIFYVAMNFCGKILKSVEVTEKSIRTFFIFM